MINSDGIDRSKPLRWPLARTRSPVCVHFMHNAEHLGGYPNLPAWLSRSQIYGAWCGITVVGLVGFTCIGEAARSVSGYWFSIRCLDSTVFFTIAAHQLRRTRQR